MGYNYDDSFPFDLEPNGIPFGSESEGKLSPRSYPIKCDRKWKHSFLSVTKHFRCQNQEKSTVFANNVQVSKMTLNYGEGMMTSLIETLDTIVL